MVWIGWFAGVILALALILLFGLYIAGAFRSRIIYRLENIPGSEEPRFPVVLASLSNSLRTSGDVTGFWVGAEDIYKARLDAIRRAKRTIHFETYEMDPGKRADDFAEAIACRAEAGVEVKLVIDNYGAKSLQERYWRKLRASGVEVGFFHKFSWRSPIDNLARTHRKLLLIDGEIAFSGGAGVSDDWDGRQPAGSTAPWLDFEVRLVGPIVTILEGIFLQNWTYVGGTADTREQVFGLTPPGDSITIVTPGNPFYRNSPIDAAIQIFIFAARERIWIASPYLVPNSDLREALLDARKRGIDVRLLTMGPCNNRQYVYYTARELYGELLNGGVKVYEYQPTMMHAKAILVDRHWVSIGSANLDPRSFFLNDELNISTTQLSLVENLEQFFLAAFDKSNCVTRVEQRHRSLWQRAIGRFGLLLQRQF